MGGCSNMNRRLCRQPNNKNWNVGVRFGLPVNQLLEVLSTPSHAFDWPKQ